MRRATPPLDAIEAFLQATRSRSFREAADELAISPSAYSRRLRALERFLGAPLFDRSGPRPALNGAGRRYLDLVAPAIETIRRASLRPGRGPSAPSLRLMAPHSLAIGWLAERLPSFVGAAGHRDVDLTISRDLGPLRMGAVDVAIASGPRDWQGLPTEGLAPLPGILACAPALVSGIPAPSSLEDLGLHRLLAASTPRDLWSRWLAGAGYRGPALSPSVWYDTASLLYEAAAAGFGIVIAVPFLADRPLAAGRLHRIGSFAAATGVEYRLVFADERVRRRADVQAFTAWAHAEADRTLASFKTIV